MSDYEQLELPDPARPIVGRFHTNSTDTERQAANLDPPRRGTQRAAVLEAIQKSGSYGATDFELNTQLAAGRSVSAGTRRQELIADGWPIIDSGCRRPTDTGTPAIVWVYIRREAQR